MALLATPLSAAQAASAVSAGEPLDGPPESIVIEVISVSGQCEDGDSAVAVAVAEDNTSFTVTQQGGGLTAIVGPGQDPADVRKSCQLRLAVQAPPGWTYAIQAADHRAYVSLAEGASALARLSHYFVGFPDTTPLTASFEGPIDDTWALTDETPLDQLSWAPCGEIPTLALDAELRVAAGTSDPEATSLISLDGYATDGESASTYHLAWRECAAGAG